MNKDKRLSSCEIPAKKNKKTGNTNRHYSHQGDFTWKGVKINRYKPEGDDWAGITRQALIGASGETAKFHLRYFEIEPGGYSSFETHKHEHVVISIRGEGKAQLNKKHIGIGFLDVIYIKPDTPHRLYNPYKEPFGFICIVNAKRDRPKPLKNKVDFKQKT